MAHEKSGATGITLSPAESNDDFTLIESWVAEPRVWRYLGPPFHEASYKRAAMAFAVRSGKARLYLACADDVPVGVVGLSDICPINRRANCWYALGDTWYAGRGIMRTACGLLVREGFTTLDLHSLYAWAIVLNEASIRILEANGFARFGVQRQAFRFDERFVDIAWYDQLAAEWMDGQTA